MVVANSEEKSEAFKDIVIMGKEQFKAIKNCIKPSNETFDVLVEEWINNSKYYWMLGPEITVDESIYAYDVKNKAELVETCRNVGMNSVQQEEKRRTSKEARTVSCVSS